MTVVETERFLKDVQPLMPESERVKLVAFVGANPEAGDLIPQTGIGGGNENKDQSEEGGKGSHR